MALYQYRPLGKGEIRLAKLMDTSTDKTMIRPTLSIFHAPLQKARGSYEALSYVWGDTTERRPILSSGQGILLGTPNLTAALCALLRREPEAAGKRPPFIWIDAICINQSDTAEKSKQVSKMRAIYRGAARTVAYLGDPADGSEYAMMFARQAIFGAMRKAKDYVENTDMEALVLDKYPGFREGKDSYSREHIEKAKGTETSNMLGMTLRELGRRDEELFGANHESVKPRVLKGVGMLLARPYFQRAWIIQELAVAKDTVLLCGTASCNLELLGMFMSETMTAARIRWEEYLPPGLVAECCRGTAQLISVHELRNYARAKKETDLLRLARTFRSARATLGVDKVYALLGLCDHTFRVDYGRDKTQTYLDLAKYFIAKGQGAGLLHEAARSEFRPAWPTSWVPDWEEFPIRTQLAYTANKTSKWFPDASAAQKRYHDDEKENGKRNPALMRMKLRVEGSELVTEAAIVQKIWTVGRGPAVDGNRDRQLTASAVANARHIATIMQDMRILKERLRLAGRGVYHTGEDIDAVLAATLEANQNRSDITNYFEEPSIRAMLYSVDREELKRLIIEGEGDCAVGDHDGGLQSWGSWLPTMLSSWGQWQKRASDFTDDLKQELGSGSDRYMVENMAKATVGRRLAMTDKSFVGLVPAAARPGDMIVILRAADVPFVLRKVDMHWRLIGDCYIHGMMLGELFKEGEEVVEMTEIRIR